MAGSHASRNFVQTFSINKKKPTGGIKGIHTNNSRTCAHVQVFGSTMGFTKVPFKQSKKAHIET